MASMTAASINVTAPAARGSAFMGKGVTALPARPAVRARRNTTTRAVQGEILISVEKPLGCTLNERKGAPGVVIGGVNGNAKKAGLKSGDVVVYHSSFFGDELWPADKVSFARSAINACPNQVDFIVVRGPNTEGWDVKRLPKRPAPPRFGKKLTAAQKERATHVCVDCGYVYTLPTPFEEQGRDYQCPQCNAPKSRFSQYDPETGRAKGGGASLVPLLTAGSTVLGLAGMAYYVAQVM